MRKLIAVSLFCFGLFCLAQAQVPMTGAGNPTPSAGCSQATAVLAQLDGGQNSTAYTNLICGLVTDGVYSKLDGLFVAATNSLQNFQQNLANPGVRNLTGVNSGSCTFTANVGITGDASTCYFSTNVNLFTVGGNWTLNSATMGTCIIAAGASNKDIMATIDSNSHVIEFFGNSGGNIYSVINSDTETADGATVIEALTAVRTSNTQVLLYQNGSLLYTNNSDTSTAIPNLIPFLLAVDYFPAGPGPANFTNSQFGYFFFGGGLTATQVANLYARLKTYLQAVGSPTHCVA